MLKRLSIVHTDAGTQVFLFLLLPLYRQELSLHLYVLIRQQKNVESPSPFPTQSSLNVVRLTINQKHESIVPSNSVTQPLENQLTNYSLL